jgi:hypothetical protein
MDPKKVPIPHRLKRFPTYRGYPVHFTVYVSQDGIPNFKSMDESRRMKAFEENLCHLCGWKLRPPFAFIGGPESVKAHRFVDGPMHVDCAEYAAKVCPFLSNPSYMVNYNSRLGMEGGELENIRPEKMALVECDRYAWRRNFGNYGEGGNHSNDPNAPGQIVSTVGAYIRVDWDIMPQSPIVNPTEIPLGVAPDDSSLGGIDTPYVKVGTKKDEIDKERIVAATFHPFADEWGVVFDVSHQRDGSSLVLLTVQWGECVRIEKTTVEDGMLELLKRYSHVGGNFR